MHCFHSLQTVKSCKRKKWSNNSIEDHYPLSFWMSMMFGCMTSSHWLPPSLKPSVYCIALMRLGRNIKTHPSIVHNLQDILRHEGSVKMSDVNIMKQMRCISNPFFTSERLVGVNYGRHLKRIFRFGQNLKKRTLSIGGRWHSMAIIIKTWERFGQKLADESQHSGNHYSWQFAGKSRTCLSLCVFGGHILHRLECHIYWNSDYKIMLPKVFTCTAYTLHRSNSFSYHLIRAHMWNLTQIGTSDEGLRLAGEQNSADNSNCGRCSGDRGTTESGT